MVDMKRLRKETLLVGLLFLAAGPALAADWFVATNGNDSAAGASWGTAMRTIQAAVDAAADDDTVWVSNGVYATGQGAVAAGGTNRVTVGRAVMLRSVNGPQVTIIDGSNLVRGVYLATNAVLDGFTVTRCWAATSGGGIYCDGDALVTNCHILRNSCIVDGGGVAHGRIWNCLIAQNRMEHILTHHGAGVYCADVRNSQIFSNSAVFCRGAGIYGGTASNCAIQFNVAEHYYGGGAERCQLDDCVIVSNTAELSGGGVSESTNRNCLIAYNTVYGDLAYITHGGGANESLVLNCTVFGNSVDHHASATPGHGTFNCTVENSIVYSNGCSGGTTTYSCVDSTVAGEGNITNNPGFMDDFHLRSDSACVDAGTNSAWLADSLDLDGGPRIRNGRIDMGCYEQSRIPSLPPPSIATPAIVGGGEAGIYRTTNGVITIQGLKSAGTLAALSDGQGSFVASSIQQDLPGTVWSNSLPFTEFQSTFTFRSATNAEADSVGTNSTVLVITRAGMDTPSLVITSTLPVLFYSATNVVLGGTINPHVVGTMWITNRTAGEWIYFSAPVYPNREWLSSACILASGTNSFTVLGTNIFGALASNSQFVVRGGFGPPALTIVPQPPAYIPYASNSISLAGANNEHVAMVCISNSLNAAIAWCEMPNGSNWVAPPVSLDVGTNVLFALGFNVAGHVSTSQVQTIRIESNQTISVSAASTNPVPPFLSWDTAATNFASAMTIASEGMTIRVAPGTYQEGLTISKGIRLASVDGPHATTIRGNGGRCITITDPNAVVSGFTITGGRNQDGAGVHMSQASARVENCIVVGNGAETNSPYQDTVTLSGGGIFGGSARNCLITSNFLYVTTPARYSFANACGAGTASCMAENCTVVGNTAGVNGYYEYAWGGCHGGSSTNCIIVSNPGTTGWHGSFDSSNMGDPGFADDGEYHLAPSSPCINAGSNQEWMADATDLDGDPRILGGTVDIGCYETIRDPALPPPAVDAPIVVSSGSSGLCRSTNDAIWVQGTKPANSLAILSMAPLVWYSTNGMFQTAEGTIWSNLVTRNWESSPDVRTWRFRSASSDGTAISSGETLLSGTAAGFGGLPEIQIDTPISTDHWAHATQYAPSGSRNAHTCERMWASNPVNGAAAYFDAALYPASNWVASSMPLAMGANVLQVFGTNMLGAVAMAEYEIFRSSFGAPHSASNGAMRIDWVMPTDPAGIYQWQRSIDLPGGIWSNLGASISATQEVETLMETNTAIPAFFRMIRTGD